MNRTQTRMATPPMIVTSTNRESNTNTLKMSNRLNMTMLVHSSHS